jgi:hypothetical protein
MRKKIWKATDLQTAPAPAVGGGEAIAPPAPAKGIDAGGEAVPSDIRLKDDIVRIGRTNQGLPLYRFRYKGGSDSFAGVMAQDVLGVMPEAVSVGADGYYRVNYAMLGVALRRI